MANNCEHDILRRVTFYAQSFYRCANCNKIFKVPEPALKKEKP